MKQRSFLKGVSIAELYSRFGVIVILLIATIAGSILSPDFLSASNLLSVAKNVGVYCIIAIGMTMLLISGGVDLSAGSSIAFSSCVVAIIFRDTGSSTLAIVMALLGGLIIGAINGFLISYLKLVPFIVTLALMNAVRGLAYLLAGGAPVYGTGEVISFLGQGTVGGVPMLLIVVIVFTALAVFVMNRTSFGRYIYAIGGNHEAARASGINVKKYLFLNYVIMGVLTAFGGVLYAGRTNSGLPAGGVSFEFEAIIGSVLGGTSMMGGFGNVICSIIGCFIVGIINNVMNLCSVNAFWQQVVKGLVILVAILIDKFTRDAIMKSTKKN